MPSPRFQTNRAHQVDTISWAAKRCQGIHATYRPDKPDKPQPQRGVLLADGVGMGKTREALGAAALILFHRFGRKTHGGQRRERHKQTESRVLVLCPPGLVSKWADEVHTKGKFNTDLKRWISRDRRRRGFIGETLAQAWCIRRRGDLPENIPDGTYICNWNVVLQPIGSGNSKLSRFLKNDWKVVIVDEAHHKEARDAIATLDSRDHIDHLLLLSATPFQLDPKEMRRPLAFLIGKHHHGRASDDAQDPLRKGHSVWNFAEAMGRFFDGGEPPERATKQAAEGELRQLVARSKPITSGRKYQLIQGDGTTIPMASDPARMEESKLKDCLTKSIELPASFQARYLRERMRLATRTESTRAHIPRALLSLLTKPENLNAPLKHPRLAALSKWIEIQAAEDLSQLVIDGIPRKMLIFTTLVNKVHQAIANMAGTAFMRAWKNVRDNPKWRKAIAEAPGAIDDLIKTLEERWNDHRSDNQCDELPRGLSEALRHFRKKAHLNPFAAAMGIPKYRMLLETTLTSLLDEMHLEDENEPDQRPVESRDAWVRQRLLDTENKLDAIVQAMNHSTITERYSGEVQRRERDRNGYAFCSPVGPWIMVASRAGSEGIDLHTFSMHLVHYDLEWNPAVMEQREGRCDRIGRHPALRKMPVTVSYLLLKGTYDERMFHQVITRQRWQPLLWGQQAKALAHGDDEAIHARSVDPREADRWMLNLTPRP